MRLAVGDFVGDLNYSMSYSRFYIMPSLIVGKFIRGKHEFCHFLGKSLHNVPNCAYWNIHKSPFTPGRKVWGDKVISLASIHR